MQSQVIFSGNHYDACAMRDGSLIVTSKRKQKGVRLVGNSAPQWIEAIKSAVADGDTQEAHMLCRAVAQRG